MADRPCIIGKSITIRGSLSGNEDLVVEGLIEGSVALSNHLTVEPSGTVDATVDVEDLTVHGSIQGDISASRSVTINDAACVVGNISTPRIVIEDGARFRGSIEMDFELPSDIDLDIDR